MPRRTYDGWGYSPLDQITTSNVRRLQPAWVMSTGMNNGQEAPPIVNNGVMFVSTSFNQVIAIDAKAGNILWRYTSPTPAGMRGKPVSRGVALYGDKVFFGQIECVVVALDARTGKEVWKTTIEENKAGFYMTAAPLIADGKVIVGVSGGDGPIRGFVTALDIETGSQLWKTYTIPAPGEPGSETWSGDQWKTGGGATWVTGNYDPESNLVFWGVGNPYPWVGNTAARRQSLHRIDCRHRRRHRQDQRALPVHPERILGLGRSVAAHPRRLQTQWQDDQRPGEFFAQRLSVFSRAH